MLGPRITLLLSMLLGATACDSPALDSLLAGGRDLPVVHELEKIVHANRRAVGRVVEVTSHRSTPAQIEDGYYPHIYSEVRLDVLLQLDGGEPAPSIQMIFAGGRFPDFSVGSSTGPVPRVGEVWALALHYPNADYSSPIPSILLRERLEWR